MGVDTHLTMSTPIGVRRRGSVAADADLLSRVARDRSGDTASQAVWKAMVAGDRPTIRAIASAFLASTSNAPTGLGRERWLLTGAAAHADHVEVRTVNDLMAYVDAMEDGLTLMQMSAVDFGSRGVGVLESPVTAARRRIAETREAIMELVQPGRARPWVVVRNLSFFGDLFVSAALARSLIIAGDNGNAEVVRAAHIRRLHQHPEMAVQIVDELLDTTMHPWALNTKAGALGDLCQFTAAAEVALLSIAVCPNDYSGNVGRRAFRNIGRMDLSAKSNELAIHFAHGRIPRSFGGTHRDYISLLAADILHSADRRDLAELQMQRQRSTADWARVAREAIDTDKSPLVAVESRQQ